MWKKLLLAVLLLALVAPVEAARRWFVQTSDNKIISFTDDDNAPTPDGTIAVADAVIRTEDPPGATGDITPLGTWDGMTYTAPSGGGINAPFPTIPRPTRERSSPHAKTCWTFSMSLLPSSVIINSFGRMLPVP